MKTKTSCGKDLYLRVESLLGNSEKYQEIPLNEESYILGVDECGSAVLSRGGSNHAVPVMRVYVPPTRQRIKEGYDYVVAGRVGDIALKNLNFKRTPTCSSSSLATFLDMHRRKQALRRRGDFAAMFPGESVNMQDLTVQLYSG
jgi:hypothetical protein